MARLIGLAAACQVHSSQLTASQLDKLGTFGKVTPVQLNRFVTSGRKVPTPRSRQVSEEVSGSRVTSAR